MILCALVLVALCGASCKRKQEPTVFYTSSSSHRALTTSSKVSLSNYTFDSFLNRDLIKVSEMREGEEFYGVLNGEGEVILPVSYTSLSCEGDFLVAEGGEQTSEHYVFDLTGKQLAVLPSLTAVADIGGGYFAVVDGNASTVYNGKGENVLPGTELDETYEFSSCGNFILAQSRQKGRTFVFHALTSDVLLSFFDTETTEYVVAYMGGADFVALKNDAVDASSDYDIVINRGEGATYYKQTARRYTVGVSSPTVLSPGRFIVSIANRYSIGYTEEDRRSFSLKEGNHAVSYYKTEGKTASGALAYYVADGSLQERKAMPDGVSPLLSPINGVAAALSSSGAIVFVNESGDVVNEINDAVYQDIVFSGEVVVASKIVSSGVVRRGALDKTGKVVVPFEYSYISAFVGERAIAAKEGRSYVITSSGAQSYVCDESFPYYFDGFYRVTVGEFIGVVSFEGVSLVPASYQGFAAVRRYGNVVYVALTIGSVIDVYRLS